MSLVKILLTLYLFSESILKAGRDDKGGQGKIFPLSIINVTIKLEFGLLIRFIISYRKIREIRFR